MRKLQNENATAASNCKKIPHSYPPPPFTKTDSQIILNWLEQAVI